jgi:hypothetical protein
MYYRRLFSLGVSAALLFSLAWLYLREEQIRANLPPLNSNPPAALEAVPGGYDGLPPAAPPAAQDLSSCGSLILTSLPARCIQKHGSLQTLPGLPAASYPDR